MFWKWYHFFQSFFDFSWKVFLEFCRFRYSNFAYDFFPGLYEFLKKRTTLVLHSRYLLIFQVSIRNQSESIGLYSGIYRKRDWNLFSCHLNMFQMIDPQFDPCSGGGSVGVDPEGAHPPNFAQSKSYLWVGIWRSIRLDHLESVNDHFSEMSGNPSVLIPVRTSQTGTINYTNS